jgi:hypothetical protein
MECAARFSKIPTDFMEICWAATGFLRKDRYMCRCDEATATKIFATFCFEHTRKEQGYENFVRRYCCVRQDSKGWAVDSRKQYMFYFFTSNK